MSDLLLSTADQQNLQAAIRSMLVCAPYQTLAQWRLANHRAVRRLVDGDMAFSYVGTNPFEAPISEEIGNIGEFPRRVSSLVDKFNTFERAEKLGVWNRSTLWEGHMGAFLRSSYYNEFARPLRALDGVGLAVRIRDLHAGLQIHRDSERVGGFGKRGVALLQLLLPAFQVGAEMAMSYFAPMDRQVEAPLPLGDGKVGSASHNAPGMVRDSRLLTRRELEVVRLLAARRSNHEIAELLHVSRATAKRHTENILLKLGLHSRREVERVINDT